MATPKALELDPRGYWPYTKDGVPVVTQSMVTTFNDCPREVYYGTVLGLRPRLEAMPLTRGTWVHALLEERANGNDWLDKHNEIYEKFAAQQFVEEVDALEEEVYNIVTSYDWVYRNDKWKAIAAELTVERPMFGGKALYRGRIDLIVQDEHGDVWLVDHKTHRVFPEWQYRELSFQHYSYLWACRKAPSYLALGIPQPKGFIYDYCKTGVIKAPTLRQDGKLSRVVKPSSTTMPVFTEWLRSNNRLATVKGQDLLAIEDPEELAYVEEFLAELKYRDYSNLFRRDYLEFGVDQQRRQLSGFLASARRMLQYKWDNPDVITRGTHAGYKCRYQDLSIADLMHGNSEIEQQTKYKVSHNPLAYYDNSLTGKEE